MNKRKISYATGMFFFSLLLMGMASGDVNFTLYEERPLAYVRKFKPDVTIFKDQKTVKASKAEQLFSGDTLQTDDNGFALVQFMDKSIAKVKPSSMLIVHGEVNSKQSSSARIALELGEIFLNVTKRTATNFEVSTSTSVASVKGTRFGARDDSYYWVEEGVVGLMSNQSGQATDLTANMYGQINDDGSIETGELTDEQVDNLNSEYDRLEDNIDPKTIKMRFIDENGQLQEIELQYFDNE